MSRYALVFVGLIAAFLAGSPPGGDRCVLSAVPKHACCAQPAPEPTSSCCSSTDEPESRADTDHQNGCDCIHPPSTPADTAASTAATGSGDDTSPDPRTEDHFFARTHQKPDRAAERLVRVHPPPPVFLLGCSFLI